MTRTFTEEEALAFLSEIYWGNASGSYRDELMAIGLAQIGTTVINFGPISWLPRPGNPGNNFYFDEETGNAINSLGLPNIGFEKILLTLEKLKPTINSLEAKLLANITPGDAFIPKEIAEMTRIIAEGNLADIVKGNASCPNVIVDGEPKPNVCYDLVAFREYLVALTENAGNTETAIKIAPITEPSILQGLVEACVKFDIDYIVAANTIGNCYIEKPDGTPAIDMPRGGLSGEALRPIVRGMIQMIVPMLKGTNTKLIAVGGISNGAGAYEYLKLGAHGFTVNTALTRRNGDPSVLQEIAMGDGENKGLVDLLIEHGLPE